MIDAEQEPSRISQVVKRHLFRTRASSLSVSQHNMLSLEEFTKEEMSRAASVDADPVAGKDAK